MKTKWFTYSATLIILAGGTPSAFGCPGGGGGGQTAGAANLGSVSGATGMVVPTAVESPAAMQARNQQLAFQAFLQQQYLQQQATQQAIAIAQMKQAERDRRIALRQERTEARLAKREALRARNLARRSERQSRELIAQQ